MTLNDLKRVLRETHNSNPQAHTMTKEQMWQVRWQVCDSLLERGTITKTQHTAWTSAY